MIYDDSVSLVLANAVLYAVVSSYPEIAGPSYVDDGEVADDWDPGVLSLPGGVFDLLLSDEIRLEREFAEFGYCVCPHVDYRLAMVRDDDANVVCRVGAVIDDGDTASGLLILRQPVVDSLVGGNIERPLRDRLRVCTYLVRLGCQCVGLFGDSTGFLREAVGRLRDLIALTRLGQGDDSGDASDCSYDRSDGRDDFPDVCHGNQSTSPDESEVE